MTAPPIVRTSLLPEGQQYEDRGCELAPACLACPFPKGCEKHRRSSSEQKRDRDRAIVHAASLQTARNIGLLARTFDVSQTTILRVLKAADALH